MGVREREGGGLQKNKSAICLFEKKLFFLHHNNAETGQNVNETHTNGKTILSGDTFKLPIEIFSRVKGKIEMKGKKSWFISSNFWMLESHFTI